VKKSVTAIILAAGMGSRMESKLTKQKMKIAGKSVLWHSVNAFNSCSVINDILVVCRAEEIAWAKKELCEFFKVSSVIEGGKTRAESANLGFNAVSGKSDYVAIHDTLCAQYECYPARYYFSISCSSKKKEC
jgi:2-C-methyl-D-erythritol 4-phosphate cytidylyltransferase